MTDFIKFTFESYYKKQQRLLYVYIIWNITVLMDWRHKIWWFEDHHQKLKSTFKHQVLPYKIVNKNYENYKRYILRKIVGSQLDSGVDHNKITNTFDLFALLPQLITGNFFWQIGKYVVIYKKNRHVNCVTRAGF